MLLDCIIAFYIIVFLTLVFFSINAEENERKKGIDLENESHRDYLAGIWSGPRDLPRRDDYDYE